MSVEQFTNVSFYIVAHADDWQLFMQPNAYNDLVAAGSRVVFVITTAGDAGIGKEYWNAREEGAKSSVRFCLAPSSYLRESSGTREINQHSINWWSVNNATYYFLRLPDGNLDGNGFSVNNYQSLSGLRESKINTISAVDCSTTYYGWFEFFSTLQTIIVSESRDVSNIRINYLNPDTEANPNDHPDHIATGQALKSMAVTKSLHQVLYVGYSVGNNAEKLSPANLFWKAGMFAAYEKTVFDKSKYSTLGESVSTYLNWCLSSAEFIIINPG